MSAHRSVAGALTEEGRVPAAPSLRRQVPSAIHRALTAAPVMFLKARMRNLLWRVKGWTIVNPSLHAPVTSLLFVCEGNICRSPFAAVLGRRLLDRSGHTGVSCHSAGLRTRQSECPPEEACEAARARGLRLEEHQPVLLTDALAEQFDLIVVMEARQMVEVRRRFPRVGNKVVLLPLLRRGATGYARYHIADPFGHPYRVFDACYERIEDGLSSLIQSLTFVVRDPGI